MLITEDVLKKFLEENNADFAIITNYNGAVLSAVNVQYEESIAAMSAAILSMCDKFLEDLEKSAVMQIILKTNDAFIIFTKIDKDKVVLVSAKHGTNIGMILHQSELLAKKLN